MFADRGTALRYQTRCKSIPQVAFLHKRSHLGTVRKPEVREKRIYKQTLLNFVEILEPQGHSYFLRRKIGAPYLMPLQLSLCGPIAIPTAHCITLRTSDRKSQVIQWRSWNPILKGEMQNWNSSHQSGRKKWIEKDENGRPKSMKTGNSLLACSIKAIWIPKVSYQNTLCMKLNCWNLFHKWEQIFFPLSLQDSRDGKPMKFEQRW